MLLAAVMLTVGCSDDGVEDRRQMVEVEVAPYASDYTYLAPVNTTRATVATWAPTGYYLYTELDGADDIMKSNENAKIHAFFSKAGTADPDVRSFRYVSSGNGIWKIDEAITASTAENPYYLYGLVPYGSAEVAIEPYKAPGAEGDGNYADGAIMTFSGLGNVMSMDPCVVVGAKHGSKVDDTYVPAVNPNPMKAGDFSCIFGVSNSVEENTSNYLFLLFDHLYSAIRFRFRVGDEYAKLRNIHLKKLEMLAYTDASCEDQYLRKKFVRTTVTLHKTDDGSSPIVGDVIFTPYGNDDMTAVEIYKGDKEIPHGKYPADYTVEDLRGKNIYTDNMGFVPNVNSYFKLISTYDVYDTNKTVANDNKGNLVRKNCVAENKIDPFSIFQTVSLGRRKLYTLNLTIEPTYLYMLSEPDLDNPTVTVE